LLSEEKLDEIVLQVDEKSLLTFSPIVLKAQFIILSEGLINSNVDPQKNTHKIDYNSIEITDIKSLATELSKITGLKFSIEMIK